MIVVSDVDVVVFNDGESLLLLMRLSNCSLTLLPNLLTVEVTDDDHWAILSFALDSGVV